MKLSLSSAALESGLDRAKRATREAANEIKTKLRKETGQARDAGELLGRTFGVQLPAQVQKFAASVGPVRSLLASTFQASIFVGFGAAAVALIPKINEVLAKLRDWHGIQQAQVESQKTLNEHYEKSRAVVRDLVTEMQKIGATPAQRGFIDVQRAGQDLAQAQARVRLLQDEIKRLESVAAQTIRTVGLGVDVARQPTSAALAAQRELIGLRKDLAIAQDLVAQADLRAAIAARQLNEGAKLTKTSLEQLTASMVKLGNVPLFLRRFADQVELTPQGPIGQGGIFSFLRGLDEAEAAVFQRFRQSTLQDIFTRAPVGKFADLDRELKKVTTNMGLFKERIQSAFDSFENNLTNAAVHWRGFGNVFLDLLAQIHNALLKTFVVSPFVNFLTTGLKALLGGGAAKTINIGGLSFPPVPTPPIPKQHGGPVMPGRAFLVGERGPELFVPGASGQIVPNGKAGGTTINYNVDARGGSPGIEHRIVDAVRAAMRATKRAAVAEVRDTAARTL